MTDEMKLIDVTGKAHPILKYNTSLIMVAGWIFLGISFIFNCIFYMIHPSATDVSLDAYKRRLLFGEEGRLPRNELEQSRRMGIIEENEPGSQIALLERLRRYLCICEKEIEELPFA